jgi:hypothetical protein
MVHFVHVRVRGNTCPGAGTCIPAGRMKDVKRSGGKGKANGGATDLLGARRIMIPGGRPWFA